VTRKACDHIILCALAPPATIVVSRWYYSPEVIDARY
jgi:hypothetical protein